MGVVEPFELNTVRIERNEIQKQFKKITANDSAYLFLLKQSEWKIKFREKITQRSSFFYISRK